MAVSERYRRNNDVVSRQVLDERLLVPIRGQLADLQQVFMLNPVAETIWQQLDGAHDVAAIRDVVVAEFEVEPEQAEADVAEFVAHLREAGLIREVD
jgi:hypothetical protein